MPRSESIAYVLHSRAFRNTSMIAELFTREFGRVSIVAKGAKKPKSRYYSLLNVFGEINAAWQGNGDLYTLVGAEQHGDAGLNFIDTAGLNNKNISSAYYINELILNFMGKEDAHRALYDEYKKSIQRILFCDELEVTLRLFEKNLLLQSGYGLNLVQDVETGDRINKDSLYCFDPHTGPTELQNRNAKNEYTVSGEVLYALENDTLSDKSILKQAKELMRYAISSHLGDKQLKTRNHVLHKTL